MPVYRLLGMWLKLKSPPNYVMFAINFTAAVLIASVCIAILIYFRASDAAEVRCQADGEKRSLQPLIADTQLHHPEYLATEYFSPFLKCAPATPALLYLSILSASAPHLLQSATKCPALSRCTNSPSNLYSLNAFRMQADNLIAVVLLYFCTLLASVNLIHGLL